MSKIICDVCGTTYAETADQCPICGCAKPENAQVVSGDAAIQETTGTYTYVKGGRFSKANVAKRNKAMGIASRQDAHSDKAPSGNRSNTGLVVAMIVLILAIVAAIIFIISTLTGGKENESTVPATTTEAFVQTTTTTAPQEIPCTDLTIPEWTISFDELGNSWLLNVTLTPEDATDEVEFESADPSVATVTDEGRVTAVGAGQTAITITCGEVTRTCMVVCNVETAPTTEETVAEDTEPEEDNETYHTNKKDNDVSIKVGESFNLVLKNSAGDVVDVNWTSSEDGICTIEGNTITGKAVGTTTVSVTRGGKEYYCIVRVYAG